MWQGDTSKKSFLGERNVEGSCNGAQDVCLEVKMLMEKWKKEELGLVSCRRTTQSNKPPLLQELLFPNIQNVNQGKWKKENPEEKSL